MTPVSYPCRGCGHPEVHHRAALLATIDASCKWRGCGCPWYIAAPPLDEPHRLSLSHYERDNLLHALIAASGHGMLRSPLYVLNSGDWLMQVLTKLGFQGMSSTDLGQPNVAHEVLAARSNAAAVTSSE